MIITLVIWLLYNDSDYYNDLINDYSFSLIFTNPETRSKTPPKTRSKTPPKYSATNGETRRRRISFWAGPRGDPFSHL